MEILVKSFVLHARRERDADARGLACLLGRGWRRAHRGSFTVNDDETDNIFREPIGRFAEVEEDVEPTHLLVSDYASWLS